MAQDRQNEIEFLSFEDICGIHKESLERYGGSEGILDQNGVESSLAQALWMMRFGGDIADMAAAYLYHFAVNQSFADGNKRTALAAALEFLLRNGYMLDVDNLEIYDLTMRAANKQIEKPEIAEWLRDRLRAIE
jgi:death on curing protein